MATKRFLLTEAAFIGGTLLTAGSVITPEDLGEFKDPSSGKMVAVKPPATAIEIDADGRPMSEGDADAYQALVGSLPAPASEIQPFTVGGGVASPTQAPGGLSLAANQLAAPSPVAPKRRGGNSDVNQAAEAAASAQLEKQG